MIEHDLLYQHPPLPSEEDETVLPPCYCFHGFLGTGMTLRSVAKMIHPFLSPVLFDLPNHGKSPRISPGNFAGTENLVSQSIDADCTRRGLSAGSAVHVLGHSLGAKYAMLYALRYPERVQSLVILDIAPMEYPPINRKYIELYQRILASRLENRRDAIQMLRDHVPDESVVLFLAKNLCMINEQLALSLNIDELARSYDELRSFPAEECAGKIYSGPTLVLCAEETEYFPAEAEEHIQRYFPQYQLKMIPNTTHVLHIDNPTGVESQLCNFYENILH